MTPRRGRLLTMSIDRRFPPPRGDERAVTLGWLDWQRATVHRKCEGLGAEPLDELLTAYGAQCARSRTIVEQHGFVRSRRPSRGLRRERAACHDVSLMRAARR